MDYPYEGHSPCITPPDEAPCITPRDHVPSITPWDQVPRIPPLKPPPPLSPPRAGQVRLPSQAVESHTEEPPTHARGDVLDYGPYAAVRPFQARARAPEYRRRGSRAADAAAGLPPAPSPLPP